MTVRFIAGPLPVGAYTVEKELKSLWRQAAGTGSVADASLRVVTANVVAVGKSRAETDAMAEVLARMIVRAPCRIIIVTSAPDADSAELSAEAALIGQDSGKCRACVCCEFIRLTAFGNMTDRLPGLIASLAVSDLPLVLWWNKPPFERADFLRFAEKAGHIVVDSDDYTASELAQLAVLAEYRIENGLTLSDLNWIRLAPYRRLFAQFFDSAACRKKLATIEEIRIEAREAAGRLLAGWLHTLLDKNGLNLPNERIHLTSFGSGGPGFRLLSMKCAQSGNEFVIAKSEACTLDAHAVVEGKILRHAIKDDCQALDNLLNATMACPGRDPVFEIALSAGTRLSLQ